MKNIVFMRASEEWQRAGAYSVRIQGIVRVQFRNARHRLRVAAVRHQYNGYILFRGQSFRYSVIIIIP